jgi:hypothetical protein
LVKCWACKRIYVSNPKCGCSTIKHSLKTAQAAVYGRSGKHFERAEDPHIGDDCLKHDWLSPTACRQRYLITCVRNPFTRALSGFLDKVKAPDTPLLPEFGYRRLSDFEEYLQALADCDQRLMNPHFRPQHINLDSPRVTYDAVFFLENLPALSRYLAEIYPAFELQNFVPHSRGAGSKLREHYSERAADMVRTLFAKDFELFGYSRDLDDAGAAPGEMFAAGRLLPDRSGPLDLPAEPHHATPGMAFEKALRFRRLIDMRLI